MYKKTPEHNVNIIKAYKYFPHRLIQILEWENVLALEDKNTLHFDEEWLKIFTNKLNHASDKHEELFKEYFSGTSQF